VVVAGMAANAPARRANLKTGDIVMSVAGKDIGDLATLYRSIWSLGAAGVEVPVTVYRDGKVLPINLRSADRASFLKKASLH
jgi:S1-C subfamily serine protease